MVAIAQTKTTTHSNRWLFVLATSLCLFLTFSLIDTAHAAPVVGFNPGRIIDDGVFTNSNSMNAAQVQAFLNSKVPTCNTNHAGFYGDSGTWYGPPFICLKDYSENGLSAAQIIYNIAQQYQINPQVLIVLLQKEQGLVTDTWPASYQYKTATGYGCPDTAACDTQYYGFTNQLGWSAKMFRSILNNSPGWYTPYILGNNFIQWNPNSSCGGTNVTIANRSTQALYNYTPYQPNQAALNAGYGLGDSCSAYGNRNFYIYFTDWFGSTQFPQPIGGYLNQQQSNGAIYLIDNTPSIPIKYLVPDWPTMQNYGLDAFPASSTPDSALAQMTDGGVLTNLTYDSNGVYLVNNGYRLPVTTDSCIAWGFSCSDGAKVKNLNSVFQTQYLKQGNVLTDLMTYNGVAYKLSAGEKQPVANTETLIALGLSIILPVRASSVNANQKLGNLLMTTPNLVKFSPNQTIYYYNGSQYFSVPDMDKFYSWGLGNVPATSVPLSGYNNGDVIPSTSLGYWAQDSSGNHYVINNGYKLPLSTDQQKYWPSATYLTGLDNLIAQLPSGTLGNFIKSGVDYYQLSINSNDKHYVTSISDFVSLGGNNQNTTYLNANLANQIKTGLFAFPDGTLIKIGADPAIYVMSQGQLLHIPSMSILNAYSFNASRLFVYPPATGYPIGPDLSIGKLPDNTLVTTYSNSLFVLSPSQAISFGLKSGISATPITLQLIANATQNKMTNLIRNSDDGSIYYAANGSLHHIQSMESFRQLGGGSTPLTPANSQIINLFTIGQDV